MSATFGKIGARGMLWHPGWWGFYIQSIADGTTVYMTKTGSPPSVSLEYSLDGGHVWLPFDADEGSTVISLNAGEKAHFRGMNDQLASSASAYHTFGGTGEFNIGGNIMSLLDGTTERTSLAGYKNFCLASIFNGCTSVMDASSVSMPVELGTSLSCFNSMFKASSLISAPELPAKTITQGCYAEMFRNAKKLIYPPSILPAEKWMARCYYHMFTACAFSKGPHISAQSAGASYVANAMDGMFRENSNFSEVSVDFLSWPSAVYWLYKVKSTGVFRCSSALGTNDTIARGVSRCPDNWTVINTDSNNIVGGWWGSQCIELSESAFYAYSSDSFWKEAA